MPDKDIFDRNLEKGWRNVARCIYHGVDPGDVANRVRVAFQKNIKALGDNCEKLYNHITVSNKNNPETALKIFDKARCFERNSDDRDLAGIITKAYLETYIKMSDGRNNDNNRKKDGLTVKKNFVKSACKKFLDRQLHSKVDMIERCHPNGRHWSDPSYKQGYFQELDSYLEIIAETLVRDPSFTKPPSFPRHHRVRQTTEELMDAPLELMEG